MNSTAEMEDDDKFNETYDFSYFKSVFNNIETTEISKILSSENALTTPLWFQIMDILALTILSCGFVANLGTIYILSGGSKLFTAAVRILLRHQAGIDAFCSVCAIILIVQPPFWLTGRTHIPLNFYRRQTKFHEDNVFTRVCPFTGGEGGGRERRCGGGMVPLLQPWTPPPAMHDPLQPCMPPLATHIPPATYAPMLS